jgi:DNA-binding NarL/FixJ family response regulator
MRNRAGMGHFSGLSPNFPEPRIRVFPLETVERLCDDFHIATTILIVDDHPAFRRSARRLLESEGFDVVGEAVDGASAVRAVDERAPDVVLLDIALPDSSGFDVAARLADGPAKVVLTSSRTQSDLGPRLRDSQALGFIPKDRLSGDAIRTLLDEAA